MTKGCIYYTDFHADEQILNYCREQLRDSFSGDIISVSLNKPCDLGKNIILKGKRGYVSMIKQIISGLETLTTDFVFFTEADCLYNPSHFDFTPPRDDIFYYNENVYRWQWGSRTAIRHDRMIPLSTMCCNRELALRFYRYRWKKMEEVGLETFRNPQSELMRKWGFEPGTKKKKRGGLTDDDFETWSSVYPVIDIRHKGTFSPPKTKLSDFTHKPKSWEEIDISKLTFNL
jgi:hypothetical protein